MFDHLELVDLAQKAAGDEVGTGADADLLAAAWSLGDAMRALAAASGHVLAELEARGTCLAEFGMSTAKCRTTRLGRRLSTSTRSIRSRPSRLPTD